MLVTSMFALKRQMLSVTAYSIEWAHEEVERWAF